MKIGDRVRISENFICSSIAGQTGVLKHQVGLYECWVVNCGLGYYVVGPEFLTVLLPEINWSKPLAVKNTTVPYSLSLLSIKGLENAPYVVKIKSPTHEIIRCFTEDGTSPESTLVLYNPKIKKKVLIGLYRTHRDFPPEVFVYRDHMDMQDQPRHRSRKDRLMTTFEYEYED
jgi:hypothetical protein